MADKHHVPVRKRVARKRTRPAAEPAPQRSKAAVPVAAETEQGFLDDVRETRPWLWFGVLIQLTGAAIFTALFGWQGWRLARLGWTGGELVITGEMLVLAVFVIGCGLSAALLFALMHRVWSWRHATADLVRQPDDARLEKVLRALGGMWRLIGAAWLLGAGTVAYGALVLLLGMDR